jgi:hypothetical protein
VRFLGRLRAAATLFCFGCDSPPSIAGPQTGADTASLFRSWRSFKRREPAFAGLFAVSKKQGLEFAHGGMIRVEDSTQHLGVPRGPGPRNSSPAHADGARSTRSGHRSEAGYQRQEIDTGDTFCCRSSDGSLGMKESS